MFMRRLAGSNPGDAADKQHAPETRWIKEATMKIHPRGENEMKRVLWIFPALLLLSISARAQALESASNVPAWEISGGYSYLDANLSGSHFHMNGGFGTTTENLNNWFGGRVEAGVYQGNEAQVVSGTKTVYSVNAATITYGPVFSYRKFSRFTPYGHVQFGAVHGSTQFYGISQSAWKFAMAPGAGVDFNVNRLTAIRVDGEYLLTRFVGLTQQNLNVSVGLVLRFGHK
jgi:opacity protein-like surface antigen